MDQLLEDLDYLELEEIKALCRRWGLPYFVQVEVHEVFCTSLIMDRRNVLLQRLRHFLVTGAVQPATLFPAAAVSFTAFPEPSQPSDRIHYGQYRRDNQVLMDLLAIVTGGHFRDGPVAQTLLYEFWSNGTAPTVAEFVDAWSSLRPDSSGRQQSPWPLLRNGSQEQEVLRHKVLRSQKARQNLEYLDNLELPKQPSST
jgi:hypothetical protein